MSRKKNRHADYEKKLEQRQQTEQEHFREAELTPPGTSGENKSTERFAVDADMLRVILLAVIAITLIVNTFIVSKPLHPQSNNSPSQEEAAQLTGAGETSNSPLNVTKHVNTTQLNNPMQDANIPKTQIKFEESLHNFGVIKQNTENSHIFKFKNTGLNPLIITTASGSCGCTVPEWPKEPIPPGGNGEIKVTYSPGTQQGKQHKTVTIFANTDPPQTIVNIKADVIPDGTKTSEK